MRYDDDDNYYRHEDRAFRGYDRWLTSPPDEPEHCTCCEENQARVNDLEECLAWVAAHRFYWLATKPGEPMACALMPYTAGDTVVEAPTQREALEKLWREHE